MIFNHPLFLLLLPHLPSSSLLLLSLILLIYASILRATFALTHSLLTPFSVTLVALRIKPDTKALSLDAQVALLDVAHQAKKSSREKIAKYHKFLAFKTCNGYSATNAASVSAFLVNHANACASAKTVRSTLSQLRTLHVLMNLPFLSSTEEATVKRRIERLEFEDSSLTRRVIALPLSTIQQFTASLNLQNIEERCVAVCINLGHDGLLRGIEATRRNTQQDPGAIVADFDLNAARTSLAYSIDRTKTSRRGPPIKICIPSIATKGHWDAVSLVDLHLRINGLGSNPSAPFFPSYVTTSWLRTWLKRLAKRHGISPALVGNHCLRAGGATDLFKSDLPSWTIKKYGRWASDAALLYQRDELDIWKRVQQGFLQLNSR